VLEVVFGASDLTRSLAEALPEGRLECVIAQLHDDTRLRQQLEFEGHATTMVAAIDASSWQLSAERPLPELFDVVVLRHGLHRAVSPRSALAQARRWLAPGGVLLVAERHADWSADFLHGLDPAWWHEGADQPQSSLLSPAAWQGALADVGFEAIELACEPAAEDLSAGAYLLLARKPAQDAANAIAPQSARWLLLADGASAACALHLQRHLESWAQQVAVVVPGLPGCLLIENHAFQRCADIGHAPGDQQAFGLLAWFTLNDFEQPCRGGLHRLGGDGRGGDQGPRMKHAAAKAAAAAIGAHDRNADLRRLGAMGLAGGSLCGGRACFAGMEVRGERMQGRQAFQCPASQRLQ
jgi:hypothetical protein